MLVAMWVIKMAYNLDDTDAQQVAYIAQLQVPAYILTSLTRRKKSPLEIKKKIYIYIL